MTFGYETHYATNFFTASHEWHNVSKNSTLVTTFYFLFLVNAFILNELLQIIQTSFYLIFFNLKRQFFLLERPNNMNLINKNDFIYFRINTMSVCMHYVHAHILVSLWFIYLKWGMRTTQCCCEFYFISMWNISLSLFTILNQIGMCFRFLFVLFLVRK